MHRFPVRRGLKLPNSKPTAKPSSFLLHEMPIDAHRAYSKRNSLFQYYSKMKKLILPFLHLISFLLITTTAVIQPISVHVAVPIGYSESPSRFWRNEAIFLRGGDIELQDNEESSFLLQKFRNVIRSMLAISDKKARPLSSILRGCFKTIESLTGIKLLPTPADNKESKKKKKKKSTKKISQKDKDKSDGDVASAKKKEASSSGKASGATKKHLSTKIKSTNPNYRIQREMKEFIQSPPPNLSVKVGSNIRVWIITMVGAKNTIYEGEVFKLRVSFPPQYPTVPPSVYFVQGHIPTHEHVYTNGDICLSLLGKDWRPTMTAQSIAVSILSILSSAQSKSLPMDNARHAGNKPGEYQKDWVYHDDNC